MRKGFTVVEILIAMMLLFTAIGFVNISIKTFNNYQRKSEVYQDFYITALSLKDWISTQPLDKKVYTGIRNDINYKLSIKTLLEKKNYTFSMALGEGNHGDYLVTLYQIEMILTKDTKEDKFRFLLTKQLSLRPDIAFSESVE